MLRAIIVDDEVASVRTLEMLLAQVTDRVEVVGVARSAVEAADLVTRVTPDIVFLDIEMPGGNGFDFLEKCSNPGFDVVFVTAYDNYAVKAFRFSAIDYLLKPIDLDDLIHTIARIEKRRAANFDGRNKYYALFENLRQVIPSKLVVTANHKHEFLNLKEVVRFDRLPSGARVIFRNEPEMLIETPFNELESILNERYFVRINDTCLINLAFVKRVSNGKSSRVILYDSSELEVSLKVKSVLLQQLDAYTSKTL